MPRTLVAGLSLLALALLPPLASAEPAWPERPLRIVVPLAAGGGADALARAFAQSLARRLGRPVIVDNRAGAGGNLGTEAVVRSPPDGYTLLLTPPAPIAQAVALYRRLPYDPQRDLVPIGDIALSRLVCAVPAALPVHDVAGLLAHARAHPGEFSIGSWGYGSQPHLVQAQLDRSFGIQTLHVPYKGEAPLLTELLGGQLGMGCASVASLAPHLKTGRLRALAVLGPTRAAGLPDVPIFAELGYRQDVLQLTGPYTLLAPAATPPERLARLSRELMAIVRSAEMAQAIEQLGMEALGNSAADAAADYRRRLAVSVKAVQDTGITLD